MEAIRNYLDAMFLKLPDTEETRAAKEALGRRMENRYHELISQGKSESEVIGLVIAEFSANSSTSSQETTRSSYQYSNPYQNQPAKNGCRKKKTSGNKVLDSIMSVFWPTVTCIYLIYSFLTFDWYISWIIWPIAAVVRGLIVGIFFEEEVQ